MSVHIFVHTCLCIPYIYSFLPLFHMHVSLCMSLYIPCVSLCIYVSLYSMHVCLCVFMHVSLRVLP